MTRKSGQTGGARAALSGAGGFIAWLIGSGFATGQEILQFFSSYSLGSFAAELVCFAGFMAVGGVLMLTGFDHREADGFNLYGHYCGRRLGAFYSWMIPFTVLLTMAVLVSGAGATLSEYYGVNHNLGSAIMAFCVLAAYLIGFKRMVSVISKIGPVIIAFSLAVGIGTLIRDWPRLDRLGGFEDALAPSRTTPNWLVSALLYVSLNFLSGTAYYNELGASFENRRTAVLSAVIGTAAVILCIALMSTGIMLNADSAAALDVPTLYLARKLSPVMGAAFSVILLLGIFSACAPMMWSVVSRFADEKSRKGRAMAAALSVGVLGVGLFPFDGLLGVVYPMIGYIGLPFIGCVLWKGLKMLKGR